MSTPSCKFGIKIFVIGVKKYLLARFSAGAGHYTQLVWAESEELGCGYTYYKVPVTSHRSI